MTPKTNYYHLFDYINWNENVVESTIINSYNWEKAISATAIHYINDLIRDIAASPQDFYNVSKHWSELKGFSLAFQFNRRSPLTAADFEKFHRLIGDKPVLESAGQAKQDEYVESLKEARAILAKAYSFAKENVGDDKGENGW